jgi:hypothetical protein
VSFHIAQANIVLRMPIANVKTPKIRFILLSSDNPRVLTVEKELGIAGSSSVKLNKAEDIPRNKLTHVFLKTIQSTI